MIGIRIAMVALVGAWPIFAPAATCAIDPAYSTFPPRVVVADDQTGAMGSVAARVDAADRAWILAIGDGFFPGASTSQVVVARLGPDGRRDPAFGTGGIARVQLPSASGVLGGTFAIAPNGDGVVAWNVLEGGQPSIVLARITPLGALRSSFGAGGLLRLACPGAQPAPRFASGIVVDALDRVVVSLSDRGPNGSRGLIARLDVAGALDPGFGDAGCVDVAVATAGVLVGSPSSVGIDGFGRLVAVIPANTTQVLMLTDAGAPDPGFGTSGIASTTLAGSVLPARVATAPGGRLLVAQSSVVFDGIGERHAFDVAALTPTGALDPAFDGDGVMQFVLAEGGAPGDGMRDIIVSASGDIALLGQVDARIAMLRIRDDGAPDSRDCDPLGRYEAGLGGAVRTVATGGAFRDGRIILLGHAGTAAGSALGDLVAFGVRPSLVFVDGFEPASP